MTREETSDVIKIMQAYVDGAEIEFANKGSELWRSVVSTPLWDFVTVRYRIKPNELKPGVWYESSSWFLPSKFIGMDDDYYVFLPQNSPRQYCTVNVLPSDIREYKHTS